MNQQEKDNLILASNYYQTIAVHGNLLFDIADDARLMSYVSTLNDDFDATSQIIFANSHLLFHYDLQPNTIKVSKQPFSYYFNINFWSKPIKLAEIHRYIQLDIFT